MYWFSRPPYFRYVAVALLVGLGLFVEFRPDATALHPFAAADIPAGSELTGELFESRPLPRGLLDPVDVQGRASHDLLRGEPLTASAIDREVAVVPDGWWALEVPLPPAAVAGMAVRLIVRPPDPETEPRVVPGIVIASDDGASDPLGFDAAEGLVAVPERDAAVAAVAVTDRRVTVLLTP